jgi:hypothetical protein
VLEDANSIQMSLMQIMRLLLTGQIEHKTASLLLYALQTASTNLRQTNFKPWVHEVILDPRDAAESVLDQTHLRDDEDFEEEEEEEEADEVEQEIRKKVEEAAEKARFVARWEAKKDIEARERGRKRYEGEEMLKDWVQQNPGYRLVRRDGRLVTEKRPEEEKNPTAAATAIAVQPVEKKPVNSTAQVREQINGMIRQNPSYRRPTTKPCAKKPTNKYRKSHRKRRPYPSKRKREPPNKILKSSFSSGNLPQRLKPRVSVNTYGAAENRTLSKKEHIHRSGKESHLTKNQGNAACDLHHHLGTVPGME